MSRIANLGENTQASEAAELSRSLEDIVLRLGLLEYRVADLQKLLTAQLGRQIVALDDGFVGARTRYGWIVLGQEEFRSVLHLADGLAVHEPATAAVISALVQPGDRVVDIGAHIGLMTIPMARAVGPEGHVFAFEPNPRTAESLRRTVVANGLTERCSVHVLALSDQPGEADYYIGTNSMMGSLTPTRRDQPRRKVAVRTLDAMIPHGERLSLVKIDAEGAEIAVLSGMSRLVAENPEMVVIAELGLSHLERVGMDLETWLGAFEDAGLSDIYIIDEAAVLCRPMTRAELSDSFSVNLVFLTPGNSRAMLLPDGKTSLEQAASTDDQV